MGEDSKTRQQRKFSRLHKSQQPPTRPSKGTVVNLSSHTLDDALHSLLQKGFNFAVTPRSTPIEDILAGVEKAIQFLPEETAEEAREETVRIIKSSSKPRDNLTKAQREALRSIKKNTDLTILPKDKGNATVILNTVDYKQKVTSLLEDLSYKSLTRDPTESTERINRTTVQKINTRRGYMQTTASNWLQTTAAIWAF